MFSIRFSGQTNASLTRLIGNLARADAALHDQSAPLTKIKKRQIKRWATNFTEEGGIYETWPPIAAYGVNKDGEEVLGWTGRDRVAMGLAPDHEILVRSEGTFASFVTQNEAGEVGNSAVDWTFRNTGGGARGGAYPVSHHTGYTTALGSYVPARKLWDLDEEDADEALEITEQYINKVIRTYFSG